MNLPPFPFPSLHNRIVKHPVTLSSLEKEIQHAFTSIPDIVFVSLKQKLLNLANDMYNLLKKYIPVGRRLLDVCKYLALNLIPSLAIPFYLVPSFQAILVQVVNKYT